MRSVTFLIWWLRPNASIRTMTAGCAPPSFGRASKVSIFPSGVLSWSVEVVTSMRASCRSEIQDENSLFVYQIFFSGSSVWRPQTLSERDHDYAREHDQGPERDSKSDCFDVPQKDRAEKHREERRRVEKRYHR